MLDRLLRRRTESPYCPNRAGSWREMGFFRILSALKPSSKKISEKTDDTRVGGSPVAHSDTDISTDVDAPGVTEIVAQYGNHLPRTASLSDDLEMQQDYRSFLKEELLLGEVHKSAILSTQGDETHSNNVDITFEHEPLSRSTSRSISWDEDLKTNLITNDTLMDAADMISITDTNIQILKNTPQAQDVKLIFQTSPAVHNYGPPQVSDDVSLRSFNLVPSKTASTSPATTIQSLEPPPNTNENTQIHRAEHIQRELLELSASQAALIEQQWAKMTQIQNLLEESKLSRQNFDAENTGTWSEHPASSKKVRSQFLPMAVTLFSDANDEPQTFQKCAADKPTSTYNIVSCSTPNRPIPNSHLDESENLKHTSFVSRFADDSLLDQSSLDLSVIDDEETAISIDTPRISRLSAYMSQRNTLKSKLNAIDYPSQSPDQDYDANILDASLIIQYSDSSSSCSIDDDIIGPYLLLA
ncbi:Piso0_005167 [Millerozyma farinosa CBS 7064]|uniref:Piso0_005167 protein n=1 Tax=Pichia sorbitophila (strain ATCC MYA-4447 / BCRC 22081 / CBS 7064 / NBRC 10061 / NRRL Y-12695) TaxID=559304 RepID=G8Y4E3_PICSO|nr:Piso0_005167 [Millerozyma farinosa CBS 7064]